MPRRLVVVGGSDAGISAALRARELDPTIEVRMLLVDDHPNFSICGLPFLFSGEVTDWRTLAHRTRKDIEAAGIKLFPRCRVLQVEADAHRLQAVDAAGQAQAFPYDRLLLATGAVSRQPAIPGSELPGVFTLRFMGDAFRLLNFLEHRAPRRAVIVGSGYIGLEMADALAARGVAVTLLGRSPTLLKTLDPTMSARLKGILEGHGLRVHVGTAVTRILVHHDRLLVEGDAGLQAETDVVLLTAGAAPNTELGETAGCALGAGGAMLVDRCMRTGVPDIFAAGDCTVTFHRQLQRDVYLPLGTTAHKQGRVAGANMLGCEAVHAGTLGTQAVKLFDHVAARTGLGEAEARREGFAPLAVDFECLDHKAYYPGATPLHVRLVGDLHTGRLLGAQLLGAVGAEVSKRLDILATALHHGMFVEALAELDLSYTPPLSSPWDPVQMAAQAWERARRQIPSAP